MAPPRITGLLHNCALNSALPILLEGIGQLAQQEEAGILGNLADNLIFKNYKHLKDLFANHYRLDHHPAFNWRQFHRFLAAHSFSANEILFAPVFRKFIAEVGFAKGDYQRQDLGLLRDIQPNGCYTLLPNTEAIDLFHNQFGISVKTYEYIANKGTADPKDNYNLVSTRLTQNREYPFGTTPVLELYLKGHHFEIQPHECLEEPNKRYIAEINALPPALSEIHDGLSISQNAHSSNQNIGRLTVYGSQVLTQQLAEQSAFSPEADEPVSPRDEAFEEKEEPGKCHQGYLISAGTYAITGQSFHSNTAAGKQTFAMILLAILLENKDKKALTISAYLDNLAIAASGNETLASYYMDKLATAIIDARANLTAKLVTEVVEEIELDHKEKISMRAIITADEDENQVRLVRLAEEAIQNAWQLYQETKDEHLIKVINQTRLVAIDPTPRNIREYNQLRKQVEGKRSLGKTLAGLMLTIIGAALVVAAVVGAVITTPLTPVLIGAGVGIATLGISSITAGACFFAAGRSKGLYKKMGKISDEASEQLTLEMLVT